MNHIILALLVCVALVSSVSSQFCKCSNYGSSDGCTNFAKHCFWNNNECVPTISTCASTPAAQCHSPSCQLLTNKTCIQVQDFTYFQINRCQDVVVALDSCPNFGCVLNGTTCQEFDTCSQIQSEDNCQQFVGTKTNSETFCSWLSVGTSQQCVQVSGCKGLKQATCQSVSFCQYDTTSNICEDIVCKGLNQVSCLNAKSQCLWNNQTVTSTSSVKGACASNSCGNYGDQTLCNTNANFNFCAWNGQKCEQCDGNQATYLSITAITILFVSALAF